jgi:hypothetical protein
MTQGSERVKKFRIWHLSTPPVILREPKATKNPRICFMMQMQGCFALLCMTVAVDFFTPSRALGLDIPPLQG